MIRNKTIRKPSLGRTFIKFLSSMTVFAVIICVLLTAVLNSLLKSTITNNEISLWYDVSGVFERSLNIGLMGLGEAETLTYAVNAAPATIGRDVAVFLDDELIAYSHEYMCMKVDICNDLSESNLVEDTVLKDSYEYEIPLDIFHDYADRTSLTSVFPFLSTVYSEGDAVTTIGCVQIENSDDTYNVVYINDVTNSMECNLGTYSEPIVLSDSFGEYQDFNGSDYKENIGPNIFLYDNYGNAHTISIKATPNKYVKSILSNTKGALFIVYAIILAVGLIIGVVISIISYYGSKSNYEVFVYRTNLTNVLAHDLKTPLMAISSYAENYGVASESAKKDYYVSKISGNVEYMNGIISNVLNLASAEGTNALSIEEINLDALVDDILEQLSSVITKKNLTVTKTVFTGKAISTDKLAFKSSLVAVIENSVKYAPVDSEIKISSDESALFIIINTFEGEIKNLESIKEPYVRGSEARGESEGFGLGLAIADANLSKLGFNLNVEVKDKKFVVKITN